MDKLREKIRAMRSLGNDPGAKPAEAQNALAMADRLEARLELLPSQSAQATLPKHLETSTHLCQMKVGQSGWMVPWGMVADEHGRLYLHARYTFESRQGGTGCLYVELRSDGYHVWTSEAERQGYSWDRRDSSWGQDIPVREIHVREAPPAMLDWSRRRA